MSLQWNEVWSAAIDWAAHGAWRLAWWQVLLYALATTHVTIAADRKRPTPVPMTMLVQHQQSLRQRTKFALSACGCARVRKAGELAPRPFCLSRISADRGYAAGLRPPR